MKTKKKLSVLLICVAAALCLVLAITLTGCKKDSESKVDDTFDTYKLNFSLYGTGKEYKVTGMTGDYYTVTIPSTYEGLPVTAIGDDAFYMHDDLTSVVIPDSVTKIGDSAFYDCESLESVTMSKKVTFIDDEAFHGCWALASIDLPSTLTSMGKNVFYACYALESVVIPDSLTSIAEGMFEFCFALTSVTIPDSVTSIESSAFYGCESLESIVIPTSVTSIGSNAFYNCEALTSVYYMGNSSDWANISNKVELGSISRVIYYYSETEPEEDGNFWHYVDGEIVVWPSVSSESVSFSDMTDADATALFAAIKTLYEYNGSYTVKNTDQNTGDTYIWDDDGKHYETGYLIDYFIYSYDAESGYLAYECSSPYLWCYDDEVLEDSMWINNVYYVPVDNDVLYVYTYTYDSEEDDEPEMTLVYKTDSYSPYTGTIGIVTGNYLRYYISDIKDENEWTTVADAEDFVLGYYDIFEDDESISDIATAMQVLKTDDETIYKLSVSYTYGDYDAEKPDYAEMMTYEFVFFVDENGVMTSFLYFEDYSYKELWNGEYEEGRYVYYDYYEISYEFDESYRLSDEDAAQYEYSE